MRQKRVRTEPADAWVTPGVFFLLAGSVLSNFINWGGGNILFANIFILIAKFIACCFVTIWKHVIGKAMKVKMDFFFLLEVLFKTLYD